VCVCVCVCVAISKYVEAFFPYSISLSSCNGLLFTPSARKLIYIFFSCCVHVFSYCTKMLTQDFDIFRRFSPIQTSGRNVLWCSLLNWCVVIIYQNHQQVLT